MTADKNLQIHEDLKPVSEQPVVPDTGADFSFSQPSEIPKTEITPRPTEAIIEVGETPKIRVEGDGDNFLEETIEGLKQTLRGKKKKPIQIPIVKDQITTDIEIIMESDLKEAFKALTPIQKQEFKIKGEEVAWEIRNLLKKTHIKVKTIFKLLVEWLRMLPGINRFFLEQEAKIKTDKILALHEITKNKR